MLKKLIEGTPNGAIDLCLVCYLTLLWPMNQTPFSSISPHKGSLHKKIWSNLGKSPNREGGRSTPLNKIPNLLTVFQNILRMI